MNIVIIHGYKGSPSENWFPWLGKQLVEKGHKVTIPEFPSPAEFDDWQKVLTSDKFDEDTVLIGHSLGGTYVLRLLENSPHIRAAVLVAPPIKKLGIEELDHHNASFYNHEFRWDMIRNSCEHFLVFHSDNDPKVPLKQAQTISDELGGDLVVIPGGGHLNAAAGFTEFPDLLKKLLSLLQE